MASRAPSCLLHNIYIKPQSIPAIGGSKGEYEGRAHPLAGVQILSILCSFLENLTKSYVVAPTGGWRPHLGEIVDPPLPAHGECLLRNDHWGPRLNKYDLFSFHFCRLIKIVD